MSEERKPRLPDPAPCCIICREKVTGPQFIASKPRRGPTMYMHTHCFEEEQKAQKEDNT